VKNSVQSGRNPEQGDTFEMISSVFSPAQVWWDMFRLFGITDAKNLKPFHGRGGITPRPAGFYLVIGYRSEKIGFKDCRRQVT
jgi:hypothetical protein